MTGGLAPVLVRPAHPGDRDAVARLVASEGLETEFVPGRFVVAEAHPARLPQARLPVAGQSGCCIVGAARLTRRAGASRALAFVLVHPERRGRGIGSKLVEAALDRAGRRVEELCIEPGFEGIALPPESDPSRAICQAARDCCSDGEVARAAGGDGP